MNKTELFSDFHKSFEELRKHHAHCLEVEQELDAREAVIKNNSKLSERGKYDKLCELNDRRFECKSEKERCLTRLEKLIEAYKKAADDLDRETVLNEPLDSDFTSKLYSNLLTDDELLALSYSDSMSNTYNRRALVNVLNSIAERKDDETMRIAAAELKTRYPEQKTASIVQDLGNAMTRIFNADPGTATAIYSRAYKPAIDQLITSDDNEE